MLGQRVVAAGRAVAILKDMIAIESVNPYFPGGRRAEEAMTAYLQAFFERLGLEPERQEVLPARFNVWARLRAPDAERTLLLETHMDTVTLEPAGAAMLDPVERDGKIHGRGACDDKGSLAAMLAALEAVVPRARELKADLIVLGSVDEEYLMRGIEAFAQAGPTLDAAIVGEPTSLDVVRAHKGAVRWKIRTEGRAAHTANPEKGDNAVYQMLEVARALRDEIGELIRDRSHPLLTPASFTISTIHGGTAVNIVPDACSIEVDRRTLPQEDLDEVIAELEGVLDGLRKRNPSIKVVSGPPFGRFGGIDTPADADIVRLTAQASHDVAGKGKIIGVPYGTNAYSLAKRGVPVCVFGPGDIAYAHTANEFVPVEEVEQAAEIFATVALNFGT